MMTYASLHTCFMVTNTTEEGRGDSGGGDFKAEHIGQASVLKKKKHAPTSISLYCTGGVFQIRNNDLFKSISLP